MKSAEFQDIYELTPLQEAILVQTLLTPDSTVYNIRLDLELNGELDEAAFENTWNKLLMRHPILRTSFVWEDLDTPFQVVHREARLPMTRLDWREMSARERDTRLESFIEEDCSRVFDLRDSPLVRAALIRLTDDVHRFILMTHHIVLEGWSLAILVREAGRIYDSIVSGRRSELPPARPFVDYIRWLRQQDQAGAEAFWRERLRGFVSPTHLPVDRRRGGVSATVGENEHRSLDLSGDSTTALKAFARRNRLTLNTVLQGAWALLLSRYTGDSDVVFGTAVNGRPGDLPGADSVVGMCVNTLPTRVVVDDSEPLVAWLEMHQRRQAEMGKYEFTALRQVQSWSELPGGEALFENVFVLQNWFAGESKDTWAEGLTARSVNAGGGSDQPLTLNVVPGHRLKITLVYDRDRFDVSTIERMLDHYRTILQSMVADARQPISAVSMLSDEERHRLVVEWNDTVTSYPRDSSIAELFEEQVARRPEAVAVKFEGGTLSYSELNHRANRVAHHLMRHGVGPEVKVGIALERSVEMVVGILGVLKAGGAYVPLDPDYPKSRLAYMLEDASTPVVLTQEHLVPGLPEHGGVVVRVDADRESIAGESGDNPGVWSSAEDLAYVMYTSGSTGRPKGSCIMHRSVVRLVKETNFIQVDPDDVFLQFAPISFDASTLELWAPLLNGAKLVVYPPRTPSLEELGRAIESHGVTTLWLTGALFQQMVDAQPGSFRKVRQLLAGGDTLSAPHVRRVIQDLDGDRVLINGYGPTENTTFTCCHVMGPESRFERSVPIGRPIANTQAYLLDWRMDPVPFGAPGELYAGGGGLAREYLNDPGLTAEKLVPNPFEGEPGSRLYRTGDQARYLPDGTIEFLGRIDHQVKVRGFRIELGEIETALIEHPAVRQAVVVCREDEPGDKRLVAYLTPSGARETIVDDIRPALIERLPEYMTPSAFVIMDELPLTPSGKFDRRSLPAPSGARQTKQVFVAPRSETEAKVAEFWRDLLKIDEVGIHDNFFDLGGHSLKATQLVSRLRKSFGVELPLRSVFEHPTIAVLAEMVQGAAAAAGAAEASVEEDLALVAVARDGSLPLSFAQQRLWFLDQLGMGSSYIIPQAFRLSGPLDETALRRAFDEIVQRHEVLRTTYATFAGEPVQEVRAHADGLLALVDLRGVDEHERQAELGRSLREASEVPFDLAQGPLVRVTLFQIDDDERVLLLVMHHIVTDGWSFAVMFRELGVLYDAFRAGKASPLPELELQYADFAVWQRRWLSGSVLDRHVAYWKEKLTDLPALELPTDRARSASPGFRGDAISFQLGRELISGLRALSRDHGCTLAISLVAAFQVLMSRYAGQDDVVVGTPIANRNRPEIENLIGFFVNNLVLRTDLSGDPSFAEALRRVQATSIGAYEHAELPFERLVDELGIPRDLSRNPLFQVMFVLQNVLGDELSLTGLEVQRVRMAVTRNRFDLEVYAFERTGGMSCLWVYDTDLFDRATVERMSRHFESILRSVVDDPEQRLSRVPLLSAEERRQLIVEWNDTAREYPSDCCLHELFEEQAARAPQAIAVSCGEERLTYGELDARSNQLAHHLRSMGVGPDVLVGLCVERSVEMLVGILGILKAGGAYVPLDATHPSERLIFTTEDSGVQTLLAEEATLAMVPDLADHVAGSGIAVARLDGDRDLSADFSREPLRAVVSPSNRAYVMYTSGSTGRPKGVVVEHRSLVNLLASMAREPGLGPSDVLLAVTTLSFDIAGLELLGPLMAGGAVVIATSEAAGDPQQLRSMLRDEAITVMQATPATWQMLIDSGWEGQPGLKVLCGGEALPRALADRLLERDGELWNLYGPTETTVWSARSHVGRETGPVTLGGPICNTRIYVVDRGLKPVPVGVSGELLIAGDGLARGYLGRPDLTAERFVPDPFATGPGDRLYRTGDLARYRLDGTIEFLGRLDHQVKVRGYRIELGEIESVLVEHADVGQAVVVAREDVPGDKRLVAYVVAEEGGSPSDSKLRRLLKERLPDYMVPSALVMLEALPLTATGKVDRAALPAPSRPRTATEYVAPRSGTEEVLCSIWSELLGVEQVGVHDDIFELGGHSLLATQLVSRIRHTLDRAVPLREIFEHPTVAELSSRLADVGREMEIPPLVPADRTGDLPLSFAQERLWFLDQMEVGSAYHMPLAVRLRGELDEPTLRRSLEALIDRHETLRTSFPSLEDGRPVQRIAEAVELPFRQIDLSAQASEEREREAYRLVEEEVRRAFDLSRGPLVRWFLVRLSEADHVLVTTMHHIVSDGWSIGVLFRDWTVLYEACHRGEPSPLSELAVQYGDYTIWQREWLSGEVLDSQLSYWRGQLTDVPVLELPADCPRPAAQMYEGGVHTIAVAPEVSAGLRRLCREEGVTLAMVLLGAWQVLLGRYAGQDDVAVGMPIANRRDVGLEGLIGFFVNALVLRTDLGGAPTFRELLARVREVSLAAYAHQDVPFEHVVEALNPERALSHHPLFQVTFAMQNAPREALRLGGLEVERFGLERVLTRFDLELHLTEVGRDVVGQLIYNVALFENETIERMVGHLQHLLSEIAEYPSRRIDELTVLSESERHQVVTVWNETTRAYPSDRCVHELFEEQVGRTPDATAVVFEDRRLTYEELNTKSNQLARHLRSLGVGTETMVGICVERSPELVVGLLGILKAGGAYVPVDPSHPKFRLAWILEDSRAPVVLTQRRLVAELPTHGARPLCLDSEWSRIADHGGAQLDVAATPDNLAYVLYTSGSTGKPKGVCVPHGALANHMAWMGRLFPLGPDDRVLQKTPPTFDASVWEFYAPLLAGATLVMARPDAHRDPVQLVDEVLRHRITTLQVVPPMLQALVDEPAFGRCDTLRRVFAGGEALPAELVKRFGACVGASLCNLYGPTEATIDTTFHRCRFDEASAVVPIGRPIDNVRVYVLDEHLEPSPVGVPGELFVGGVALARGYLNDCARTAERFVPDPFAREAGERLYRTGDLARYRPDGALEFLGRRDYQVKLRGYRIELGEIESVMREHPGVHQAVAEVHEDDGRHRLVGYLVCEPQEVTRSEGGPAEEYQSEHLSDWHGLFEQVYGEGAEESDPTFNITGWISSYTGRPIPADEMRTWVDSTVDRIVEHAPEHVMEIGCGTGLLLFRVAPRTTRYLGTDFSDAALGYVAKHRAGRIPEATALTLEPRRADEFEGIEARSFDTVILNSVVQYFPDVDYLVRVLEGAVEAVADGGVVFVGDVRNLKLLETFHASIRCHKIAGSVACQELREEVQQELRRDKELVIDPTFFSAIARHLPRIRDVEVRPKRGEAHNELTRFRYDVLLHIGAPGPALEVPWIDWRDDRPSAVALEAQLRARRPDVLGVRAIPNARTLGGAFVWSQIRDRAEDVSLDEVRAEARRREREEGVEPEEWWGLEERIPYDVRLSWASAAEDGSYDVLFVRRGAGEARLPIRDVGSRPWSTYTNTPLRSRLSEELVPRVREHVESQVPEYMVPSSFVILDALPLTASGKVDRKALPAPERTRDSTGYVAARNGTEEVLCSIWAELLGVDRVSVHDDFFELGGHSLLATRLMSRIRRTMEREVALQEIFEHPTVAELGARLAEVGSENAIPPLVPVDRAGDLPLSFAQERLWVLDQMDAGSAYNMPLALRLEGGVDIGALERALHEVVRRHETLRTSFPVVDEQPMQRIADSVDAPLAVIDLNELDSDGLPAELGRWVQDEARRPFDLARGPLLRSQLLRLGDDDHVLLLTMHHIVSDAWSLNVLLRELSALYAGQVEDRAVSLPELAVQYADYASWQRSWLQGEVLAGELSYWRKRLGDGPPPLDLPTDRPRPRSQSYRGDAVTTELSADVLESLRALSRSENATLFMLLVAAFNVLLMRYSSQEDILIGMPIAGRHHREIEGLIGCFLNTLVLRTDLSGSPSFREVLRRVRRGALEAYGHQDIPFEKLLEELQPERDLSRSPLFQVFCNMVDSSRARLKLPGLEVQPAGQAAEMAKFDLTLYLFELDDRLVVRLNYSTDLFDRGTVELMLSNYATLLEAVTADAERPVARLPLLSPEERRRLAGERNRVSPATARERYPEEETEQTIAQRFAKQVARAPDQLAVKTRDQQWTYRHLDAVSNRVGWALREHVGGGNGHRIALLFDSGAPMVASVLGTLRCGQAYVPLDPTYPEARLRFMLGDAGVGVIATDRRHVELARALADEQVAVVEVESLEGDCPDTVPSDVGPDSLAYILYTSGTTGLPKGVMQSHRNVLAQVRAYTNALRIAPEDRLTLMSSYTFDAAVMDIYGALLNGATLCPLPVQDLGLTDLGAWIREEGVTVYHSTPSTFRYVFGNFGSGQSLTGIRLVVFGGEEVSSEDIRLARQHFPEDCHLADLYGMSESSLSTLHFVDSGSEFKARRVPIGYPVDGTRVVLLDRTGEPTDVLGEIGIESRHVALGYWGLPAQTASSFGPSLSGSEHARLYRTGDMGRLRADGTLEFLGRLDHQVKIRGYRVELGEIESVLLEHPDVRQAVAVVREDIPGNSRLAAYVVAENGNLPDDSRLHGFLNKRLPEYMVPTAIIMLEALPRTPNGKFDRARLPAPSGDRKLDEVYVAPGTEAEERIAEIWKQILGLNQVGVHDNFFKLGGHSLLATQVVSRIHRVFEIDLPLRRLFELPTVAGLADEVEHVGWLAGNHPVEQPMAGGHEEGAI